MLTNDIFKHEMLHTYERKSAARDELVRRARDEMKALAQEMCQCIGDYPEAESLMMTLVTQLKTVKGKKKYGYLPKNAKDTVDEIVDKLEQLPAVNDCYRAWWEFQCEINDYYSEQKRKRPPLSRQKEFRAIKNAVIQEAENIRALVITFEDENAEATNEQEAAVSSNLPYDCWELWIATQDDTAPMIDRDAAAEQIMEKAKSGDSYAQYLTGKLYRDGPVLIPDSVEALYWFERAARQGYVAAQYALGKLYLSKDAEVYDAELWIQWLEYAAGNGSDCAAYRLGKEYLRGEIVETDTEKAIEHLTQAAEAGNQYAQYILGKLYLEEHNQEQALYWFAQSAAHGNEYAQFFVKRWNTLNPPSVMLSVTRLLYHMGRIFREQAPTPAVQGGAQIDRKRLAQLREKKMALGHKADDYEEYNGPEMSM